MHGKISTDSLGRAFVLPGKRITQSTLSTHCYVVNKIATFLSTSLGPYGLDKVIQTKDDEIIISNDGATILQNMELSDNPISKLVVEMSKAQDEEIGDGTTSVVILANALLKNAENLRNKGIHISKIAEGYEKALELSLEFLENNSESITDLRSAMEMAAKNALNSKIVNNTNFYKICSDAVFLTADLERKDLDFERIKIEKKVGRDLNDSALIKGIILNKEFSHPQMKKEFKNAKIALLTCPFELPKLKTKHDLEIKSVSDFQELEKYEIEKFKEMVDKIKEVGADCVINQWGFDDEANSLLNENNISAIRWVGGSEMEMIALHAKANIISRFECLTEQDLGTASIKEVSLGTENEKIIILENEADSQAVTILVRGSTDAIMEEAKRCINDAIYVARNTLSEKIIYGGGSFEIACSLHLENEATNFEDCIFDVILGYSASLEEIPLCLAKNANLNALEFVEQLKKNNQKYFGVSMDSCLDMKLKGVFDSVQAKAHILSCATQLVVMILKVDDVVIDE